MNLTKIADTLEDISDQGDDLLATLKELRQDAPVVHVAAPSVRVDAPTVNVTNELPEKTGWEFEVTQRDIYGYIKKFTAKPIK